MVILFYTKIYSKFCAVTVFFQDNGRIDAFYLFFLVRLYFYLYLPFLSLHLLSLFWRGGAVLAGYYLHLLSWPFLSLFWRWGRCWWWVDSSRKGCARLLPNGGVVRNKGITHCPPRNENINCTTRWTPPTTAGTNQRRKPWKMHFTGGHYLLWSFPRAPIPRSRA